VCCEIGAEEGGGTRKDTIKAFQWYKRAATLGDVPAQYKMGIILLKGLLGQEKSPAEAVSYLQKAAHGADAENPHALHELALLYEAPPTSPTGSSVISKDELQALRLFEQAAKFGYKYAQFKLGQAYEYGLLGCPIKARDSIIWYTKAAAQGEHQSELALSGWYLTGSEGILECSDTEAYCKWHHTHRIFHPFTFKEVKCEQKLTHLAVWARKAALATPPLPKAMFAMGYFTEVGIGCPRSLDEAKRWYGRAAAYRFPKAQERLDELRKGGEKAMTSGGRPNTAGGGGGGGGVGQAGGQVRDHREKLTRNKKDVGRGKDEEGCVVM
jgi:TPR repeat protein